MEDFTSVDLRHSSRTTVQQLTTSGPTTSDSGIEVLENLSRSATKYCPNEMPTPSRISLPWNDSLVRRAMTFLNWAHPQPGGTDLGFGSATLASFGSTWLLPTESTPYVSNQQQSEEAQALVDSQHTRITSLTVSNVWEQQMCSFIWALGFIWNDSVIFSVIVTNFRKNKYSRSFRKMFPET